MKDKILTKGLALFLAFIMTFANVWIVGIYAKEAYAAETNLEEQSTSVSKAEVEFDAYFSNERRNDA